MPGLKDQNIKSTNVGKIELEINHLTKLRLNDRTFSSWEQLRTLKKEKLKLKELVSAFAK